jgi:hypothetical protein
MLSAMLLTISVVALSQFAAYYWRAVLAGVAAQPVSERVLEAARVNAEGLSGQDFRALAGLHDLTPDLQTGPRGLGLVRLYYGVMDAISKLTAERMPSVTEWADRERMICARYTAVQIDRRMQANLALAAAIRSC